VTTSIRPLDVPESISSAVDAPFEVALLPDPDLDVSQFPTTVTGNPALIPTPLPCAAARSGAVS
jgi:hypothetical protein